MSEIYGLHWTGFCSSVIGQVLGRQIDELWWLTSVQAGAFSSAYWDELDAHLERFWLKTPAFEITNTMLLRPGAISTGAQLMNWDEWAYLVGFRATDEEEAASLAFELSNLSMPHQIWSRLGSSIELFVDDFAGGDAAVFTSRRGWFESLHTAYPQAQEITSQEWQQLFDDAEKETQAYLQKLPENP